MSRPFAVCAPASGAAAKRTPSTRTRRAIVIRVMEARIIQGAHQGGVKAAGRESGGAEHLRQLVRRRDFELIVAAALRLPIGAPALEDRRVAESIALHVVVLHLAHALDPQRLPR